MAEENLVNEASKEPRIYRSNEVEQILHTVCAYANGKNSKQLIVEVEDEQGEAVIFGTRLSAYQSQAELEHLEKLFTYLAPDYTPEMSIINLGGNCAIQINVVPGDDQPYVCPKDPQKPYEDIEGYFDEENEDTQFKPTDKESAPIAYDEIDYPKSAVIETGLKNEDQAETVNELPEEKVFAVDDNSDLTPEEYQQKVVDSIREQLGEDFPDNEANNLSQEASSEVTADDLLVKPADEQEAAAEIINEQSFVEKPIQPEEIHEKNSVLIDMFKKEISKVIKEEFEASANVENETNKINEIKKEQEDFLESVKEEIKLQISNQQTTNLEEIRKELTSNFNQQLKEALETTHQEYENKLAEVKQEMLAKQQEYELTLTQFKKDVLEQLQEKEEELVVAAKEEASEKPTEPKVMEKTVNNDTKVILTDMTNPSYIRIKQFLGDSEGQIKGLLEYLSRNVFESRIFPQSQRRVTNYSATIVKQMIKDAVSKSKTIVQVSVGADSIVAQFIPYDTEVNIEELNWDFEQDDDEYRYTLEIDPLFTNNIDQTGNTNTEVRKKDPEQVRKLVLSALDKEPCSTNSLAKALGYKGIPRSLTTIVREMINEGLVEYTNQNSRGSNQKLRKVETGRIFETEE